MCDGYPLYYDAVNEKGVGMAGLNFVGNAVYQKVEEGRENVAQYELIPWVLGQCANLQEVRKLLAKMNLVGTPFGDFPAAQLHWIIADASGAITLECTKDGLQVYDNPAGVLTNNPPFPMQMFQLNNYAGLSPKQPEHRFSGQIPFTSYSRGMGAMGLPGDLSSESRFARVAFVKCNSVSGDSETESVSQFSTFWARLISREAAARWRRESMRSRFTHPAATLPKGFTIIQPMTTTRSAQ